MHQYISHGQPTAVAATFHFNLVIKFSGENKNYWKLRVVFLLSQNANLLGNIFIMPCMFPWEINCRAIWNFPLAKHCTSRVAGQILLKFLLSLKLCSVSWQLGNPMCRHRHGVMLYVIERRTCILRQLSSWPREYNQRATKSFYFNSVSADFYFLNAV